MECQRAGSWLRRASNVLEMSWFLVFNIAQPNGPELQVWRNSTEDRRVCLGFDTHCRFADCWVTNVAQPNGPAAQTKKIYIGDKLVSIMASSTSSMSMNEVISLVTGPPGTSVNLGLRESVVPISCSTPFSTIRAGHRFFLKTQFY